MYLHFFILLISGNYVFCQECVTQNFEKGIGSFTACGTLNRMQLRNYTATNMISPHPKSNNFLTPGSISSVFSCLQSPQFLVTRGGVLEVNRYTSSKNITDTMQFEIWSVSSNNVINTAIAVASFSPSQAHYVPGWETFRMLVPGTGTFNGALRFYGRDPGSIIVIDSYRFIAPTYNKDLCKIYEDDESTITTTTTTTSTTTTEQPQNTATTDDKETTITAGDKTTATIAGDTTTTAAGDKVTTTTAKSTTTTTVGTPTVAPRLYLSLQKRIHELNLELRKERK